MSALKYSYHEERGEFHGYVEDEMGNVIYEMHYPEFYEDDETGELIESSTIFEDGFMQDADDTEGLRKYLLSMRLINEDDEVIHESEYKSTYNDGGLTSGAYGQGTSLLEEGGEMDIEEEDKEENEIEEHLQSISDDTGIPVDVLRSYADEIGTDYMDLTNDIPYNGAFGTQEDFAEHLVDEGLITDLSNYLYMTDLDIRILASEEADARLDGMDDEDIVNLAGKSDEYEELKDDLERLEELNDEIEVLESDIKARRDAFDHENATEEERDDFDDSQKYDEEALEHAKEQKELLDNKIEWSSIEDFIDDIRDDALSNANDEITEELEKDAVGYFENLGYSQQDLANHNLFSIDYDKLAEDVSYDYIFIEGEDGDYHIFNNYADGGAIPEGYHQMPDGTIMPDSAHLEHGGDVAESNLHMLKNQAEQFEHHANELQEALKKNPRVDAWVVAKAERAATDLSDITHYLEGLNHEHHGDGEDVIKMDVPLFIRSQEYAREDAKSDADLHEFADNAIDLSQSGETLEMDDYNKLVPNHMAKGGNTNPYIDLNYKDRTQEIENLFEPTLEDIKKDPKYYAELVNDLLFHWVYGTRETPLMFHAKKSLPNHMARGGVLASSSSKEGIEKLISEYYYGSKITLNKVGNAYEVSNAKGKIKGVKVVEKNGKYQFVSDTKMMARGGVNFGVSFEKFKKQVLPINIETRSEVDANTILKYADLQNVPATLKSIGDLFVVILDKPLEVRDSMEGRIKELLKGNSYAKGGGIEKKEYLDEYLKKIGIDKNELPVRALRYHTKMANKKYEKERLNDLPYKKYLVTYKIPFGAIHTKVVDARTHNEAKINFRKEHGGKDIQGNVNKILKVSLTKGKKEDGGEMARGGEIKNFIIEYKTKSGVGQEEHIVNMDIEYKQGSLDEVIAYAKKNVIKKYANYADIFDKKDTKKLIARVFYQKDKDSIIYAKGGATFQDKVDAIAPDLVGKEVPKRLRKDYGKKYNKKEALEAARRIAGSMRAKEMKKGKK